MGRRFLARIARVGIAFSLVLCLFDVHSALARADAPDASMIASSVLDIDHPDTAMALEHAEHLAGHLTGVVDPAVLDVATIDVTRTQKPILVESLPRSTSVPAPSEPPRA